MEFPSINRTVIWVAAHQDSGHLEGLRGRTHLLRHTIEVYIAALVAQLRRCMHSSFAGLSVGVVLLLFHPLYKGLGQPGSVLSCQCTSISAAPSEVHGLNLV